LSRDRSSASGKHYDDRLAVGYRIEVSRDGVDWIMVASSADRLPERFRKRVTSLPTLSSVPSTESGKVAQLAAQRTKLLSEIDKLSTLPMVYARRLHSARADASQSSRRSDAAA